MLKLNKIDLSVLNDVDLHIKNFGVFKSDVSPPAAYTCVKGAKPFSRFFYVTKGAIIFNEGTPNMLVAKQGDIVYLPYDIPYVSKWDTSSPGGFISINFILNEPPICFSDDICIAVTDKTKVFLYLFEDIYKIWSEDMYGYKLRTMSKFYEILYAIYTESTKNILKTQYRDIYKGILYIEQNYLEDIDIDKVASMCNVSPSTFRRLFKSYKQMSPITYKNYLKIKKAQELIQYGECTVTEASEKVKCYDLSYFNRLFKKYIGVNPNELKKYPKLPT